MRTRILSAVVVVSGLLSAGCGGGSNGPGNVLSGVVTVDGRPVKEVNVLATGGAAQLSALTNEQGEYRFENPPKGALKFQLTSMAPPPPGVPGSPPPPAAAGVPTKYTKPGNDLAFEYAGGKQTYNMDLKP
ncbi:peptidase associated/transthyretin-like domain-containing protein [Limnoglobus roseus]|uniref:Carboxypeptidase regulatory-like domain-containing protein n=1 Tax=Limnoglobus roseus TaxID=2598579 RepID=A0A5C1A9D6_9BACT|nr:carboxypeptidase-like regulatory domain-containing protein [Limnoglobus roseus]QEL14422.1 carboxypeptidase regulatory-like domain-containing protein [Limnoglobus roseus]